MGLLSALGVAESTVQRAQHHLECLTADFRRLRGSLEFEYGICTTAAAPHNPANLPHIEQATVPADESRVIDLEAALGKAATRGHVVNLGSDPVTVRFRGLAEAGGWTGDYEILAGAAIDTSSFIVTRVEVFAPENDEARVQLFAQ